MADITLDTQPVQQPLLAPQAQPSTIRFVPPAMPRDNGLMDLANGLKGLDAGLSNFVDSRQQQNDQADAARAQVDFHKNNAEGYQQAVQEGKVPAFASLAYVNSYKQAQGALAGDDLNQKFQLAYDAWDGKNNSEDPNAYSKFVQGFLATNLAQGQMDPAVAAGLLPKINQLTATGQARYLQDRHSAIVDGNSTTHVALASQAIQTAVDQAYAAGKPVDTEALGAGLDAIRQKYIEAGGRSQDIDDKLVDAISAQALTARGRGGPAILSLLDRNVPGTNYTLAQTPEGAAQKLKVTDTLDTWGRRAITDAAAAETRAYKANEATVVPLIQASIAQDPTRAVPDDLLSQSHDPEIRTKVAQWQDTMLHNQGTSSPEAMVQLHVAILNGDTDAINDALGSGAIKSPGDLKAALQLQAQVGHSGAAAAAILKQPAAVQAMKAIAGRALDQQGGNEQTRAAFQAAAAIRGPTDVEMAADFDFRQQVLAWAQQHPGASPQEQTKALAEITESVLKYITPAPTPGITGEATHAVYDRPAGSPQGNPYPLQQPAPASMSGTLAQPGAATQPQQPQQAQQPGGGFVSSIPGAALGQALVRGAFGGPTAATATGAPVQTDAKGNAIDPATGKPTVGHPVAPGAANYGPGGGEAGAYPKTASPAPPPASPEEVQGWVNTLSPDARAQLTAASVQLREPESQIAAAAYQQRFLNGQPPPAAATAAPATPITQVSDAYKRWAASDPVTSRQLETAFGNAFHNAGQFQGTYTVAAIQNNPKAAHILDFISAPESNGNYNAYFGNAHSTHDLSKMTVNQVLAWQQDRVNGGSPSSATGRYQFMHNTLLGLKTEMGLKGSEKFTPELQDNLALQLLKERGYDRWVAGKMSSTQFANNLAKEWASLPDMQTGRSHYAGDGLNKSLVTPQHVLSTLGAAASMADGPSEDDNSED